MPKLRVVPEDEDLYGLEYEELDNAYNPNQIVTQSIDKKYGNHTNLSVSVPPDVAGEIAKLIQSRRVPEYTTQAHFVRDAIYHRLHYIANHLHDEALMAAVQRDRYKTEMEAEEREARYYADQLERITNTLDLYSRSDDKIGLERVIKSAENQRDHTREPYSNDIEKILRKYR